MSTTRSTTAIDHAASGAPSLPIGRESTGPVIVDHAAGRILGVPIAEIGSGPLASPQRQIDAFLKCMNAKPRGHHDRPAAPGPRFGNPEVEDWFYGLFFGPEGSRKHLDGVKCPVVRLGHPDRHEIYRLDLIEQRGTVIGQAVNGRIEGGQLVADIHLLATAPIPDWDDVRCALLSLATRNPASMGVSIACMDGLALIPLACDLVALPSNRRGLLAYTPAGIESIGQPAPATAERIRALDLIYAWLAGRYTNAGGNE